MPQVAVPHTTRVVARQLIGSETAVNVWHVRDQVEGTPVAPAGLAQAFLDFYENNSAASPRGINDNHHDTWRLVEVTTQRLTSVPYPDPLVSTSTVVGVENVVPALPNQVAAVLHLKTGFASRRARGRIFLAGFHTNVNDEDTAGNSRLSSGGLTRITNALADLDDGINAAGGQLAVYSALDGLSRAVTAITVTNRWGTQRRRQVDVVASSSTTVGFLEA